MPTYVFKGRNRLNEIVVGERVADNREALRHDSAARTSNADFRKGKRAARSAFRRSVVERKLSRKDLSVFTRQFSVMIDAGLPLVQCLEILAQQQENKYFQQILCRCVRTLKKVRRWQPRWRDIRACSISFTPNMVEAGETGGILDLILQRLSTFIEKIVKLKRDIISAMIYPSAVIVLAIVRWRSSWSS
jgi:type IV pilus assembly protein PilC